MLSMCSSNNLKTLCEGKLISGRLYAKGLHDKIWREEQSRHALHDDGFSPVIRLLWHTIALATANDCYRQVALYVAQRCHC